MSAWRKLVETADAQGANFTSYEADQLGVERIEVDAEGLQPHLAVAHHRSHHGAFLARMGCAKKVPQFVHQSL